ncbi:NAD(P)H-dependent amine dehydrogenase family protein [Pontixanthobacter aquaemixtae]|uniref:Dihydrodipicolinate reductase n=1 Tax=Pontixanthobacter aquaemixtae TaxID=1958940 RepID=A0A844ZWV9_9SPHN|nr:dihydrodipicolinate reductase [Pontixanthobacter aquaemixtae]MXO89989.1 dihydrodipicolinate reductase [Pontixanthobacter aquaemixtae]
MSDKLKVVQWATGNIGTRALRAVIEHPQMELVGLWVHSPDKVGRDAAELCGVDGKSGVLATNSLDEIVRLDADCVLYMPQATDMEALTALLASGKNVVTTRGDFHCPKLMDAAQRGLIEAACQSGNATVYSTGSSPGFITEAFPVPLLSLSRRLDCLTIDEFADLGSRNSPELLFGFMGFGSEDFSTDTGQIEHIKADFAGSLAQLADAVGIDIDQWLAEKQVSKATQDVQVSAGTIGKGTVAAQRIVVTGMAEGIPRLRFRANWYATNKIENTDWELRDSGWRVQISGDTPLDVSVSFPVAPEDYAAFTPGLTAHRAVNAIPAVCEAASGIATTVSLGQVIANFAK